MTINTQTPKAALAAILCFALGACSNMDSGVDRGDGALANSADGALPASTDATGARQMPASSMYGIVQNIESVPRNQAADMSGAMSGSMRGSMSGTMSSTMSSAAGDSGTAGATGAGGDMVYRVTLRLDDGGSRVIHQQAAPTYQIGDRVRMADGMLQRQ